MREQFRAGRWEVDGVHSLLEPLPLIAVNIPSEVPGKLSPPLATRASLGEGITEVFFKESCWGLMWGKKDYIRLIFTILMLCL